MFKNFIFNVSEKFILLMGIALENQFAHFIGITD